MGSQAERQGICTIKLEAAERISGAMHACKINVNDDGELIEPEASADSDARPTPRSEDTSGHALFRGEGRR
jgi:hypothetical protein